jgi:hypothetical protein
MLWRKASSWDEWPFASSSVRAHVLFALSFGCALREQRRRLSVSADCQAANGRHALSLCSYSVLSILRFALSQALPRIVVSSSSGSPTHRRRFAIPRPKHIRIRREQTRSQHAPPPACLRLSDGSSPPTSGESARLATPGVALGRSVSQPPAPARLAPSTGRRASTHAPIPCPYPPPDPTRLEAGRAAQWAHSEGTLGPPVTPP